MVSQGLRVVLGKWSVLLAATVAALVYLHWLVVLPPLASVGKHALPVIVEIFLKTVEGTSPWFYWTALGLIAVSGISASALALVIQLKAAPSLANRYLSAALAFASLGTAYFFFVSTHEAYRELAGWQWGNAWRTLLDLVFFAVHLAAPLFLVRFFRTYPRNVTEEQLRSHYRDELAAARQSLGLGWRKWIYGKRETPDAEPSKWEKQLWGGAPEDQMVKVQQFWASSGMLAGILGVSALAALSAFLIRLASEGGAAQPGKFLVLLNVLTSVLVFLFFVYSLQVAYENLKFHHRHAVPEDRARIDWIHAAMLVGGIFLLAVSPLWWLALAFLLPILESQGVTWHGLALFIGPTLISIELFVLVFVGALAMSIFYRGAVDPRLAARRFTLVGLLGLVIAFLFILLERTIALKIVAYFNLSPDLGALIAGAAVAATIAPVRNHAEKAVNHVVGRFLPLDSMIEGERKTMVVAMSDLSGYTALSAIDEKQALLMAALLQRQAAKLTEAHGGRVVKSMGDAVMFAFDDAPTAAQVLVSLHRDFPPAAGQLGLTPLPVHSGAHIGEVTIAHDGDIYGQTVNLAARIQGSAEPGQIVVSDSFATAAFDMQYKDLGPRSFKNVPEPVRCRDLTVN